MALPRWLRRAFAGHGHEPGGDELDKAGVWAGAARRLGARFVAAEGRRGDEIHHRRGSWRIVVDLEVGRQEGYPVVRTRARALFSGRRELRLSVRSRRFWHGWLEAVGVRARPRLDPLLLERYAVGGAPPGRIPSVFSAGLVAALRAGPPTLLDVEPAPRALRRRLGERVGRVRARTEGVVVEEEGLVALVRVVEETLEALVRVGEADGTALPEAALRDGDDTVG